MSWMNADSVICQGERNSEPPELVPQRIVWLQDSRLAHLAPIQGRVQLEAPVEPDGSVKDVKAVSGSALLIDAARDSLRQWRFKGCTRTSANCKTRVTFIFVIENAPCNIDECPSNLQIDLPGTVTIKSSPARAIVN
jgi:hypothetical protein